MRIALLLLLLPLPAIAQDVVCEDSATQSDLNLCAGLAFEAADAGLNEAYAAARAAAEELDGYGGDVPYADLLRDAQRAWIAFRDAACEAEAPLQGTTGGSMAPMLNAYCLERLTLQRADDLWAYVETNSY